MKNKKTLVLKTKNLKHFNDIYIRKTNKKFSSLGFEEVIIIFRCEEIYEQGL